MDTDFFRISHIQYTGSTYRSILNPTEFPCLSSLYIHGTCSMNGETLSKGTEKKKKFRQVLSVQVQGKTTLEVPKTKLRCTLNRSSLKMTR